MTTTGKGERSTALPYYRWWVQDYRGSRNVQRLTWQQRGIYRELLDECWDKGAIPDDPEALADIVGCDEAEMRAAWVPIRRLFAVAEDGRMFSPRLEKERTAEDRVRVLRAIAGRKGGLAKASNARELESGAIKHLASSSEQFKSEQSSSAASGASGPDGLALAVCPYCAAPNGRHEPACSKPTRLAPPR